MASDLRVVGIGASAGGVEALEAFFQAMPDENGMAFVVVTHLDPNRESMLPEILGRATRMPVVSAQDGEPVAAEHVYVVPAGAILTAREGRLQVRATLDRERAPIDLCFASLAEDRENTRSPSFFPAAATTARSASRRSRSMAGSRLPKVRMSAGRVLPRCRRAR